MKKHLYEDNKKVIHLCESSVVHNGIKLVWTKCEIDVPANKSFMSTEEANCKRCNGERQAGNE